MVNIGLFNDFSRSVNRSGRRCAGARFPGVKHYRGRGSHHQPGRGGAGVSAGLSRPRRGGRARAEAHLSARCDVFMQFGAKPKRTPCSADALRKRALRDGSMPSIDPVVDLYNAVSIRYAVPVGARISRLMSVSRG